MHRLKDIYNKEIPHFDGWCTVEKAIYIGELILNTKPDICVELGVYSGRSLFAFAVALRENGKGIVHGIDAWSPDAALEGNNSSKHKQWWGMVDYDKHYNLTLDSISNYCLNEYVKIHKSRSTDNDLLNLFDDNSIDILHLDSTHSPN